MLTSRQTLDYKFSTIDADAVYAMPDPIKGLIEAGAAGMIAQEARSVGVTTVETVTAEETLSEARARLGEYRENEPGVCFKLVKTRERIEVP